MAPDGSVEWLCLPRPDSPSVFGALLDRTAGNFRFAPMNTHVPHQRRYIPGTMVLETTWHTPSGWLLVQDLLVVQPVTDGTRRPDYRRSPGDAAATGTLLRLATCIEGHVEVVANVVPVFEYGAQTGTWDYEGDGYEVMTVPPAGRRPDAHRDIVPPPRSGGRPLLRPHRPSTRARAPSSRCRGPAASPPTLEEAQAQLSSHSQLLAGLALQRHVPRSPLAQSTWSAARSRSRA